MADVPEIQIDAEDAGGDQGAVGPISHGAAVPQIVAAPRLGWGAASAVGAPRRGDAQEYPPMRRHAWGAAAAEPGERRSLGFARAARWVQGNIQRWLFPERAEAVLGLRSSHLSRYGYAGGMRQCAATILQAAARRAVARADLVAKVVAVGALVRFIRCSDIRFLLRGGPLGTITKLVDTLSRDTDHLIQAVRAHMPRGVGVPYPYIAGGVVGGAVSAAMVVAPVGGGAPPPAAAVVAVNKRSPLFTLRFKWRDRMQDAERAADAKAALLGVGTNGEVDVSMASGQSFLTKLANRVVGRSHKSYHRASNKMFKRLRTLRDLREEMLFSGVGHKRERNALNVAAAEELAKKVVSKAVDDQVIPRADVRWFKQALVETFFVRDDDDDFWGQFAAAPEALRA